VPVTLEFAPFMGPEPNDLSDVERLGPSIFRFPVWTPVACEGFIDVLESPMHRGCWATPETAEKVAALPEVKAAFPSDFDIVELIQRRKVREFPLYTIEGFKEAWESYSLDHIIPILDRLWGRNHTKVIAPFVFCYQRRKGLKSHLSDHYDAFNTFVLPLSSPMDYEGGGTYIPDLDLTIEDEQGHAHVFPGLTHYVAPGRDALEDEDDQEVTLHPELWHRTHALKRGKRYCLIGFYA